MGFGDQILASGMARGAKDRGRRIAFGDGQRIIWDHNSEPIFRGNPNIAPSDNERAGDLEWVHHYKGSRLYNTHDGARNRWRWNYDFRATPGEIYLDKLERTAAKNHGKNFILIEPHVPRNKSCAPNKDWGFAKYQAVADELKKRYHNICQIAYGPKVLHGVRAIRTHSFRDAMAAMVHAVLYIGPEGGLHHGAAAAKRNATDGTVTSPGIPAVVLFGGFIPPAVTGYDTHTNLTGGATACGSLAECPHCKEAMNRISVDEVTEAAMSYLRVAA